MTLQNIRTFKTANFSVSVDAIEEFDLDLSWDDTGEVAKGLDSGLLVAFCARVTVSNRVLGEVSTVYLGECIYKTYNDFQDHIEAAKHQRELRATGDNPHVLVGSYFADMIKEAIQEARSNIKKASAIYIRN